MDLRARLFKKTLKQDDGCWLWTGSRSSWDGRYGRVSVKGKNVAAHRLAFWIENGYMPTNVLHKCDVPLCINPEHLFAGDHASNMKDKAKKGRAPRGEQTHSARLNEANIIKIREMYSTGTYTQKQIADIFGVCGSHVSRIVNGKKWKHIHKGAQ